ncbi:MAG: hypothetical protein ABSF69_21690 [Polyangiaceae bacterium]|jgi:hypothetical protein
MISGPVVAVAKKVSAFLDEHKVPHAIAGGMAVSVHGHPRMTADVDILVPSSALKSIQQLGKTTPVSGFLSGVSVSVDGIDVAFLFLGEGLDSDDIRSPDHFAGLPVVRVEALVLMKLGAGRAQDTADIVHLLKAGKVPIAGVEKRLSEEEREHFKQVIEMARLEKAGKTKEARRIFFALRRLDPRVAERFALDLFAMSNLRPSDTGVEGAIIWVSTGEFGGADAQDGPRMKVLPGTTLTPESRDKAVSVRLTPASGRGRQAARHDQEAGGRVREREPRHAPRLLERGTEHARDAGRAHPRVA